MKKSKRKCSECKNKVIVNQTILGCALWRLLVGPRSQAGNIKFLTLRTCALAVTAAQNTENTAYGVGALANNTDGIGNSAFGLDAGKAVESYILHERELGCGPWQNPYRSPDSSQPWRYAKPCEVRVEMPSVQARI